MVFNIEHSAVKLKFSLPSLVTSMVINEDTLALGTQLGHCYIYSQLNWKRVFSFQKFQYSITHVQHQQNVTVFANERGNLFLHNTGNSKLSDCGQHSHGRIRHLEIVTVNDNNIELYIIGSLGEGRFAASI